MKLSSKTLLYTLISVFLLWSAGSWLIAKSAKQHFEHALAELANGHAKDFFELELINYQQTFYGASAELKLIPNSALINEDVENWKFYLERSNGPIFINRDGVQLGKARWQLSVQERDPSASEESVVLDELSSDAKPIGSVLLSFFEKANVKFEASALSLSDWTFENIAIESDLDLGTFQYELQIQTAGASYRDKQFALQLPGLGLTSKSSGEGATDQVPAGKLTEVAIKANDGELILLNSSKKVPFNLQSRGSVWVNNDTLSSDWQINTVGGQLLKLNESNNAEKSDYFKTDVSLQFRELLTSGFWQYLKNQSEVFSLLQQAEWAMEEVETPEQQDFLRSLYLDSDRIRQAQLKNPLKPLLIAKRSKLAANAKLTFDSESTPSQLSFGGTTTGNIDTPELALKGQVQIKQAMLNSQWSALLDKLSKRRWFRRYETEFESDITIRSERFLLNNIIVPVNSLSGELSRILADQ